MRKLISILHVKEIASFVGFHRRDTPNRSIDEMDREVAIECLMGEPIKSIR
jgi:hypothetical protein